MAKKNEISSTSQGKIDELVTPPTLTNGDIVASTKMKIITVNGDNIINVHSTGNVFTKGKRAIDGKTFSVIRTNITDESINKFLSEFVEDYNETLSFIVCEQEQRKFLEAVDNGMVDSFKLSVGLRLEDKNDEDSEIATEVSFLQGSSLEESVKRESLEAQRAFVKAKARFYSSGKAEAMFSEQLAGELQMKF